MYAVIQSGGKQYRVEEGVELMVEKLPNAKPGEKLSIDDVLLFSDGKSLEVGKPKVAASIQCLCIGLEKGEKLRTVKYKRRKNYRRTIGHRQQYTRLLVEKISKKG